MTPPLSRSSNNAGTAVDDDAVIVVDVVVVSAATSPSAPWTISPSPLPLPPPPLDAVREDRVRGDDVDDDRDRPLIIAVVMLGWLRKRTRRGTWVWRWFVLDLSGGCTTHVILLRRRGHCQGQSRRPDEDARTGWSRLLAGGGACHSLQTILLIERGGKKKTK
jgi:hypothetical protein